MSSLVFSGQHAELKKASKLLEEYGITSRITTNRNSEGELRVPDSCAGEARRLLGSLSCGRIISSKEAAWFVCHVCGESLSGGEMYCPSCRTCIGDPHGK